MEEEASCVTIVPSPGYTHLVPLIEFAKTLVLLHLRIQVKFIIPTLGPPSSAMKAILNALPSNMSFILLPQVNIKDLPQGVSAAALMQLTISHSLSSFQDALNLLISNTRVIAVVADYFAAETLSVAKKLNILSYIYYPSNALSLSLFLYLPYLDKTTSCEFRDLPEPIKMPGCIPIHGCDFPSTVQDRSSIVYRSFIYVCKLLHFADGIILNAFPDLEPDTIRALQSKEANLPPIYPVGPIIQNGSNTETKVSECLNWLHNQPCGSVLYVSFGSGGTLIQEQLMELAMGLELSGQKFVWVVRAPNESPSAAYLGALNDEHLNFLPAGFLKRTKGQGLVIASWAPQIEILSHEAIGGFLTHCGWNSTLESIINGVPLIAWPLFAEQRMNAVLLSEGLKVALRPKVQENGIVKREEIAKVVRSLIQGNEGKEIRKRMEHLKGALMDALKKEGSSRRTITELGFRWKNLSGR
ncbi:UDP-glycosyltransferase family, conserved site [Sesbania bispinosa]|nr:UDP-glycosyltransferase family, conserved site [Sesbania bispinosa]